MNNKNTGYDEIKGMLNTIRNLNESRHINKSQINENEEDTPEDESDNSKTNATTKQVKKTVIKKKLKRQTAISDFF